MQTSAPTEETVISPLELLTPRRLDVCAKHAYARLYEQSPGLQWGREVYEKHILVLNQGIENHKNPSEKFGLPQFFAAYHAVLASIKTDGFDNSKAAIPVGINGVLANGAHRTAACLLYGVSPTVSYQPDCRIGYTWDYFQGRGLDSQILDYMALEYCLLREDCLLAIVWPRAAEQIELIESILAERCAVVSRKKIPIIGRHAPQNIVRQVYPKATWLGRAKDGFKGARTKAHACFTGGDFCYVLLLQFESFGDMIEIKEKARQKIGIGNHSLHITDDHGETIRMAKMFFNANTISFLNQATPIDSANIHERILEYENAVNGREDFAVHGSSVMEAFGIREAVDLDYVSKSGETLQTNDPHISLSNEKVAYTDFSLDDLLLDPRLYFYFYGIKFVDLAVLEHMKTVRGETKDKRDVALIKKWRLQGVKWKFHQAKSRVLANPLPKYKRKMLKLRIKNLLHLPGQK